MVQMQQDRRAYKKRAYSRVNHPPQSIVKFLIAGRIKHQLVYTPSNGSLQSKKRRLNEAVISLPKICTHQHVSPRAVHAILPLAVQDLATNYSAQCERAQNAKALASIDHRKQCEYSRHVKLHTTSICTPDIISSLTHSLYQYDPSSTMIQTSNHMNEHLIVLRSLESSFPASHRSHATLYETFSKSCTTSALLASLMHQFRPRDIIQFRSRLHVIACLLQHNPIPMSIYDLAGFPYPLYNFHEDTAVNDIRSVGTSHAGDSDSAVADSTSLTQQYDAYLREHIQLRMSKLGHSDEYSLGSLALDTDNSRVDSERAAIRSFMYDTIQASFPDISCVSSSVLLHKPQQFDVLHPFTSSQNVPSMKSLITANPITTRPKTSAQLLAEMPSHVLPETLFRQQHLKQPMGQASASISQPINEHRRALNAQREAEQLQRKAARELLEQKKSVRKYFLAALKSHRDDFLIFHKNRIKVQSTLVKACARNQEWAEKRRRAAEERARKDRMKALKENDMTAYAELLREHKNDRLQHVLNQTEQHMKQLRALIKNEQSIDRSNHTASSSKSNVSKQGDDDGELKQDIQPSSNGDSSGVALLSEGSGHDPDDAFDLSLHVPQQLTQPVLLTGCTLKDYQLVGLSWLVRLHDSHMNGILADEMGLGKTVQAIALFAYLMESRSNQGPFMVVCPLSTLQNWADEFARFAPEIRTVVYHGAKQQRTAIFNQSIARGDFNVLLTTFECVINKTDRPRLSSITWQYICIDEGHRIKNSESKLSATLTSKYQSVHRLILSGTPLQNSLRELWSLLNWLLPTIFNSGEHFEEWFNAPFNATGIDNTDLDEEEKLLIIHRLHSVLRPFVLRRLKSEVAEQLPAKVEIVIKCELSAWQRAMYEQITNKALALCDSKGTFKLATTANTIMQLRKCCNHPYLFSDQLGWKSNEDQSSSEGKTKTSSSNAVTLEIVRSSGKFALLHRMLPKLIRTGHRVLIFCQMTRVMDLLEDYFEWRSVPYLRLDGSVASIDRRNALTAFNAPNSPYNVFMLSTRAGGLGLNLQTADTVILFDSDYNPQQDAQAQDRAHRIGQTKQVRVFRLITMSPVEEEILKRARFKLGLDQIVIQSGKFDTQSSADERRSLLQAVLREGVKDGPEARAPSDDEINEMIARSGEEIEIFNQMDRELDEIDAELWRDASGVDECAPPARLMGDDELPSFLLASAELVKAAKAAETDDPVELGKRVRRSTPMTYSEDFIDEQFFDALEDDNEDIFELAARMSEQTAVNAQTNTSQSSMEPSVTQPDKYVEIDSDSSETQVNAFEVITSATAEIDDGQDSDDIPLADIVNQASLHSKHDSDDEFVAAFSSEEHESDSASDDDDDWESPSRRRTTRTRARGR